MTTKASATATVESAVESPKRVKASTKKSTRKSTPKSSKAAVPSTKKSGPKPSATKTTVVAATIAAVVEKLVDSWSRGVEALDVGDVFAEYLELRPDDFPVARKNLGYAYLRVQKYAEAVEQLRKYLEMSPDAADRAEVEQMVAALEAQIQQ